MESKLLSAIVGAVLKDAKHGTFTGLVTRKKGQTRGRGDAKAVYGDDLVHVTLVTGFRYPELCARSLEELDEIDLETLAAHHAAKGTVGFEGRGKNAVETPVTLEHFQAAADEIRESLAKSEVGDNEATTDHVYDPLVVDGVTVREGRVYRCVADDPDHECHCRDCNPDDPKAPVPGTIYLKGLKIGQQVLEPAANGPIPASKSNPKTVAKRILRNYLPIGRFVSYALEPGTEFKLNAGEAAKVHARENGVEVVDES